jgi:hypothetical protein
MKLSNLVVEDMKTTSRLTWAIPIHVAQLAASLEIFLSTRDDVHMLRLCVSYGLSKDSEGKLRPVAIQKLPPEMIQMIVRLYYHGQRRPSNGEGVTAEESSLWVERLCEPEGHWLTEETEVHGEMAIKQAWETIEPKDCYDNSNDDEDDCEKVSDGEETDSSDDDSITEDDIECQLEIMRQEHPADFFPEFVERCEGRRENWLDWTDLKSGFESKNEVFLSDLDSTFISCGDPLRKR